MAWFVLTLFIIIVLGNLPPLSLINGALLKYLGIPAGIAWFMSQKSFDGKKPIGFIKSIYRYFTSPKITFNQKKVEDKSVVFQPSITYVRSGFFGVSN